MRILRKAQRFLRDRNPELTYCYRQYCCLKQQQGTLRPIQAQLYLLRLNGRFYLRGRRSLSTLQVPQYQTIARPIIPSLAEQSPQQLAEQMLQYDAVSFDVFDTLLLRPALRPSDLFAVVGSRLHLPDFPNMRIQAEQEARRKDRCAGGTGEITLAAIYQELQQKTGLPAALGMQTEWDVECDLCYANPYLLEVFERVRAAGMPLYVTSDMYLPEEQIRQLLERYGFSGFQKIQGYREGLAQCGLPDDGELILQIPETEDELQPSREMIQKMLDDGIAFDALIAADDILAVGAQKALQAREINIPIVGLNNSRFSQCTTPELTSMDTNVETVCATATQILLRVLRGERPASRVVISTELVLRDSFRPDLINKDHTSTYFSVEK